jgi:predicted unusual protein kinase regulating ubiquinone biosynthesis (AarF/ABC1/UbiB family)
MRTIPGPVLKLIEIYECEAGLHPPHVARPEGDLKRIRDSWLSRNFRISAAVLQIGARLAGASLQKLWGGERERPAELAADKLGQTLGELKGPLMKVGQLMSYADLGIPETARERLSHLQDSSVALDSERIKDVVSAELGRRPEQLFASWEENPVGVGSIGQVHRARLLNGRKVAVKVQFPGIARLVGADLSNTKPFEILAPVLLRKQDGAALFDELRSRFTQECEYRQEAEQQERFRALFHGDDDVLIPRTYPELSSGRVLTTEYVDGRSFREMLRSGLPEERSRAGQIIFRMVFTSAFRHRLVNCDPNPGNFLFPDGRVAFVDFGCVKELDGGFVSTWRRYLKAVLEEDRGAARDLLIEMGYVISPDAFDFEYQFELMRLISKPWLENGPFRFDRAYVSAIWSRITRNNVNIPRLRLPRDWLFVNRLQWGLYSVLAALETQGDWFTIMRPLLESADLDNT